jgi:flavodoxin I
MMKIGIFYGSTTGNTADAAKAVKTELDTLGDVVLESVSNISVSAMAEYDLLILGSSTWGLGEIQDDWYGKETLAGVDLSGKKVAVFGTGDQYGYGDTFADAIGILAESAEAAGATLIGLWPTEGYDASESVAVRDGHFVGLALDNDNQSELTAGRIKTWTDQLKSEV